MSGFQFQSFTSTPFAPGSRTPIASRAAVLGTNGGSSMMGAQSTNQISPPHTGVGGSSKLMASPSQTPATSRPSGGGGGATAAAPAAVDTNAPAAVGTNAPPEPEPLDTSIEESVGADISASLAACHSMEHSCVEKVRAMMDDVNEMEDEARLQSLHLARSTTSSLIQAAQATQLATDLSRQNAP